MNCNRVKNFITQIGIALLKYFDGRVVVAHQIRLKGRIFDSLLELNFDGIEAIYSKNTSEQNEFYKGVDREKRLFYIIITRNIV